MEQQMAAPEGERRALSLAEAAEAIAGLPDEALGLGADEEATPADEADRDSLDAVSGWRSEEAPDEEGEDEEGEDGAGPEADGKAEPDEALVTVTLPDGETRELPLSEVARSYATAEAQERANAGLTQERAQLQEAQSQLAHDVQRWLLAQSLDGPPAAELAERDPAEYGRQMAAWQQRAAAQEEALRYVDAAMKRTEAGQAARLEQERRKLREAWPEIAGPESGAALRQELRRGMTDEYGFGDTELNALHDHRTILMARDALAYRRMQKAMEQARTRPREAPAVLKPGTQQGRGFAEAGRIAAKRERLRRSGSLRDAAALFEDMDL